MARGREERALHADVPPERARRGVHRLHRRPGLRGRAGGCAPGSGALRGGRRRPRRPRLQQVRLGAHADRDRAGDPPDLGRHSRDR